MFKKLNLQTAQTPMALYQPLDAYHSSDTQIMQSWLHCEVPQMVLFHHVELVPFLFTICYVIWWIACMGLCIAYHTDRQTHTQASMLEICFYRRTRPLLGLGSCNILKHFCSIFWLAWSLIEACFKHSWFILEAYFQSPYPFTQPLTQPLTNLSRNLSPNLLSNLP